MSNPAEKCFYCELESDQLIYNDKLPICEDCYDEIFRPNICEFEFCNSILTTRQKHINSGLCDYCFGKNK